MAIAPIDLTSVTTGTGGFVVHGQTAGNEAGYSLANAGDVNGDGFDDLLIGAPFAPNDQTGDDDTGKAYVVFGTAGGSTAAVDLSQIALGNGGFMVRGEQTLDQAGISVAAAGDLNGDGFADIAIGATSADGPDDVRLSAGATYVVFGRASFGAAVNLSSVAAGTGGFVVHGAVAGDLAGASIAAGDVNGDGIDDLLIGAPGSDGSGAGFVVFGSTTGLGASVDLLDVAAGTGGFKLTGSVSGGGSGTSVAVGDVDGDGIADMILGGPGTAGPSNLFPGAAGGHVVLGRTGFDGSPVALADVGAGVLGSVVMGDGGLAGFAVAALGDVNADGIGDFAISAPDATSERGQAYVVFGTTGGLPTTVQLSQIALGNGGFLIQGLNNGDKAGYALAAAGDVNGDGIDDVLIGAPFGASVGDGRLLAGEAYVLLGRSGGFGAQVAVNTLIAGDGGFVLFGEDATDKVGSAVSAAGDLNGDGFADIAVGAPLAGGASNGVPTAGDSYVVYGGDISGAVTHPGDGTDNALNGTAAADVMVGGRGADTLTGNGGLDVLIGGAGDDVLAVASGFRRVDGGTGSDTLALGGADEVLDLRGEPGRLVFSIERIDLTGTGNNGLVLNPLSLFRLSEATNTMQVLGDAGDFTVLDGAGWAPAAGPAGFVTWANGMARLEVADAVTVVPCFAGGSRILTERGEIAVEALVEGDIAVLADGRRRAVRWIGHRAVQIARHPCPWDVQPVRIRAHAFGPGRPHRDLRLSPDHAVFASGHLVPIRHLVNGASIVQEHVGDITYYHVELAAADGSAAHDVLLAHGLAVESFLDTGNRAAFANGGAVVMAHPDFALRAWEAQACAPLLRAGPVLDDLRTELLVEATALGWEATSDPDLRLTVDGRAVWPQLEGEAYVVRLPAGARVARLRSHRTVPAWFRSGTDDTRVLGVAVTRITLDEAAIALDDVRLCSGWHGPEGDWRWTDGDAAVPVAGGRVLRIRVAGLERYWSRPRQLAHGGLSR